MDASQNLIEITSANLAMKRGFNRIMKWVFTPIKIVFFVAAFVLLFIFLVPKIQEMSFNTNLFSFGSEPTDTVATQKLNSDLNKQIKKLGKKLSDKTPKTPYITISTVKNEFVLYKNQKPIRYGKCSTGKDILLVAGAKKKWIFRTPKGEFRIRGREVNPPWKKPDWAFVEEGLPIPSPNHSSRWEYGVLGDYALSLGDGYKLHGTLYQRYLGLPVTHGCVRFSDEDLEVVYKTLEVGSKVYIF